MLVESLTPVSEFLDSRCSDSVSTRRAYLSGLMSVHNYLSPTKQTLETILEQLQKGKMDLYKLLDSFTSDQRKKVSIRTTRLNLAVLRSYLGYHDIDIIKAKFDKRVKVPKLLRAKEAPVDASDIRNILLACNNRRLKTYSLVLSSGAMRAVEALAIRIQDIDYRVQPTKIHIREEYAKNREERDIYISDEATQYLKKWIEWKYRNGRPKNLDDLVFGVGYSDNPRSLYVDMSHEFGKLLDLAGFAQKKVNNPRRLITLHSLRRFADSTISTQAGQDYAEWFLGHSDNSYYTKKESELREIYDTKCMKYLTFLDYDTFEATANNVDAKLKEKDQEIKSLRQELDRVELGLATVEQHGEQQAFESMKVIMDKKMEEGLRKITEHYKDKLAELNEKFNKVVELIPVENKPKEK
jgi:integrase